jgi:hypothetical protein
VRAITSVEICIDVNDPVLESAFWAALLGRGIVGKADARWVHLDPPDGLPVLNFQRVPEGKAGKNRLHVGIYVYDPEGWIAHAVELGASQGRMHDDPSDWFCVMSDPAGNEFCICLENE